MGSGKWGGHSDGLADVGTTVMGPARWGEQ